MFLLLSSLVVAAQGSPVGISFMFLSRTTFSEHYILYILSCKELENKEQCDNI